MRCGHCGTALPEDARFCLSCGRPAGQDSQRSESTDRHAIIDELKRLRESAAYYHEHARKGPVTDKLVREGTAFHLTAQRRCDALIASLRLGRDSEALRYGIDLPEYQNATALISIGQRLSVRDSAVKNMLKEVFPIYAVKGVKPLANTLARRFRGQLSMDFSEELDTAFALLKHLDQIMFLYLLEGMQRNKLLPLDKQHFNSIMYRVGIDATKKAMEHVQSIRG